MSKSNTPKNGDFASYIESLSQQARTSHEEESLQSTPACQTDVSEVPLQREMQTLEDVLNGDEPDDEFLEQIAVLHEVPPLSDEELERQALAHPGADGDPSTPE